MKQHVMFRNVCHDMVLNDGSLMLKIELKMLIYYLKMNGALSICLNGSNVAFVDICEPS